MTQRKIAKKSLKKCKWLSVDLCRKCARQDDNADLLVLGMSHGKCVHFIH